MIVAAHRLFQRQGYERTGFSEVLAESRAPRGAIYHHFPGGKEELAVAVIRRSADDIASRVNAAASASKPSLALRRYVEETIENLEHTGYEAGCPLAPMVLEASGWSPAIRDATHQAFEGWTTLVSAGLRRSGVPAARARRLASVVIAAIEGAMILARATQDPAPLRAIIAELGPMLDAAVA